ncbi:MAG: MoaD/ThiS family protein [Rhodospirillaceae bacterium]|nr:MoaD/ThiS family protein [Rhodospirillaceae bacterium]
MTLRQHTPLHEVLTELGIPLGDVHLVVINGEVADLRESRVSEQDEVKLFSAVGGG